MDKDVSNKNNVKNFARVFGAQPAIPKAHIVSVETDVTRGLHAFSIVGLPNKAVEEARDRVSSAIKNNGFTAPKSTNKKIVVSLAPADLKKEGSGFDLPIALAYLLATGDISFAPDKKLFAGELALDGRLRGVRGVLSMTIEAKAKGFTEMFVPKANAKEASLVDGIKIYGARTLGEVVSHLSEDDNSEEILQTKRSAGKSGGEYIYDKDPLGEIRGQEHAKRALEIAASGGHNVAFFGPPGTGKTMLARALASVLPPLTYEEIIEVTTIHSFSGSLGKSVITTPPFRAPHHTASYASLVGGGTIPKPGEVTLAHRGVLFLDEFPEFSKDVINALRQPLEDKVVSVTRSRGSSIFPANCILVVALNPCPCGHFGTDRCSCTVNSIQRYKKKISGPIVDRIDMWIQVSDIGLEKMSSKRKQKENETKKARENVYKARDTQRKRFVNIKKVNTNSDMSAKEVSTLSNISREAEKVLVGASQKIHLSPRGYHRTIKLARTIADLSGSDSVETEHILEALQYRPKEW